MAAEAGGLHTLIESKEFPGLAGLDIEQLAEAERRIEARKIRCDCQKLRHRLRRAIYPDCPWHNNLDLAGLRLVNLPGTAIARMAGLKKIDCSDNPLQHLPDELGMCDTLEMLVCINCGLTELPASLGNCKTLKYLHCPVNRLTELPAELGRSLTLEVICCSVNQIKQLPLELGNCPNLRSLKCRENPLVAGTPRTPEELRAARPHTKSAARE